jgi:hypothetical protein
MGFRWEGGLQGRITDLGVSATLMSLPETSIYGGVNYEVSFFCHRSEKFRMFGLRFGIECDMKLLIN